MRKLFLVLLVAWLVAVMSLFASYGPMTSPAWLVEFGSMRKDVPTAYFVPSTIGAVYELLRTTLGILLLLVLSAVAFPREYAALTAPTTSEVSVGRLVISAKELRFCRLLFFGSLAIMVLLIVGYHVVVGPRELATLPKFAAWRKFVPPTAPGDVNAVQAANAMSDQVLFLRPYLAYLPYSLVNYCAIWLPSFALTVYGVSVDFRYLQQQVAAAETGGVDHSKRMTPDAVVRRFSSFVWEQRAMASRYATLLLVASAAVAFEYHFAIATLAPIVQVLAYASYTLLAGAIVLFLFNMIQSRQRVYVATVMHLNECNGDEASRKRIEEEAAIIKDVKFHTLVIVALATLSTVMPVAAALLRLALKLG